MDSCASCKFWQQAKVDDTEYSEVHKLFVFDPVTFENVVQPYEIGTCNMPVFHERPAKDAAAVIDGSTYFAALITGEDFSCSKYDGKS